MPRQAIRCTGVVGSRQCLKAGGHISLPRPGGVILERCKDHAEQQTFYRPILVPEDGESDEGDEGDEGNAVYAPNEDAADPPTRTSPQPPAGRRRVKAETPAAVHINTHPHSNTHNPSNSTRKPRPQPCDSCSPTLSDLGIHKKKGKGKGPASPTLSDLGLGSEGKEVDWLQGLEDLEDSYLRD